MENASKALLIAGAVLIVILIIGVGMAIYSGATSTIKSSTGQMNAQQIQMFNQQIEQYVGNKMSGTKVKSLVSMINSNIVSNEDIQLTISGSGIKGTEYPYEFNGKTTDRYTISATDTNADGLLDSITITQENAKKAD